MRNGRLRVAMVTEHASPLAVLGGVDAGGQNVHVASLATALGARGVEVTVHTRRDRPDLPRRVTFAPNVVVEHVDAGPATFVPKDDLFPHMDTFADHLRAAWALQPPDVVHSHFWMSGYAALAATWTTGVPVVHTFHALGVVKRRHQGDRDTSPPQRLGVEASLVHGADHIVATCSDEVFELRRLGGDVEGISVVPCGVDLDLFRPDGEVAPRRAGWHRLVVVSRLVPRKGIDTVIRALPRLPRTELVVAGGPPRARLSHDPEARRLLAVAQQVGVADRVQLRGRVGRAAVPPLLRSADVLVSTPWYEPFGIAPVEAMATGVPVVVSAVGGMVDTVVEGVTGVHVPPRDPEALAEALGALLADPGRRHALGTAGLRRAREWYSWGRVAASTLGAYRHVLARDAAVTEEVL
ncbi:MAG TPA: glycosyltransferase [Nitriliruptorales bacterium]|nr:glycosyltransferase [Nitriliruptorales bacterium]